MSEDREGIGESKPRAWNLPTQSVAMSMGVHPARLPRGTFALTGGLDGSQDASAQRMRGVRLWANMAMESTFSGILETASPWSQGPMWQCFPFNIEQTNNSGRVWGFVFHNKALQRTYLYAKVEGQDYSDPYGATQPIWATIPRAVNNLANTHTIPTGLEGVVAEGRFLYLLYRGDASVYGTMTNDVTNHRTVWFDWDLWASGGGSGTHGVDNFNGFVVDVMGVPRVDNVTGGNAYFKVTEIADSTLITEQASFSALTLSPDPARIGDTVTVDIDNSIAGLSPPLTLYWRADDTGGYSTVVMTLASGTTYRATFTVPSGAAWIDLYVWDGATRYPAAQDCDMKVGGTMIEGTYTVRARMRDTFRNRETGLLEYIATPTWREADDYEWYRYQVSSTYHAALVAAQAAEYWTKYEVWSTISTLDKGQSPPEAYYYSNLFDVHSSFTGTGTVTDLVSFYAVNGRVDDNTLDHDPCTDLHIAGNVSHDWLVDEYRTFNSNADFHLKDLIANTISQGLHFAVQERDGSYYLIWSDTRDFRYENFPLSNEYPLKFKSADKIRFVEAGEFLFLFGDGPVYGIYRNGFNVSVGKVMDNMPLVSRHAATTTGLVSFVMCESAVWMIDGATGTPTKIQALDRLISRKWTNRNLLSRVSLAYDSELDVVVILCPGASQAVLMWVGTNRLTVMDGMTYAFVRDLETPDENGEFRQKAMFVSQWGRICELIRSADSEDVSHGTATGWARTSHGLYAYDAGVQKQLNVYVSNSSVGTHPDITTLPVTSLTLLDDVGGSAYNFAGREMSDVTISFLTGSRQGEVHRCCYDKASASGNTLRIYGQLSDPATTVTGQWISISPLPFSLVGAPVDGSSPTRSLFHQRKHIGACSFVVGDLQRASYEKLTKFPLIRAGVCQTQALVSPEPVAANSDSLAAETRYFFTTGAASVPRWLSMTDSTVSLASLPKTRAGDYAEPAEYTPAGNVGAVGGDGGVSGFTFHPVLICDVSGVGFDLFEIELYGIISESEQNSVPA